MTIVPFLNRINQYILNPLIVLLFAIALAVFTYGIFQFVRNAGNEKAESYLDGKRAMLYGLIGMFVMVSTFAIIRFILAAFGIDADIYPLKQTP